jgi:hypothetical protein
MAATSQDERIAQELQQAEMGHAPQVVQGSVVQGVPVGAQPTPYGAPRYPLHVAVVPDLPQEELIALSLRYSVMCFAFIDVIFIAVPAIVALFGNDLTQKHKVAVFGATFVVRYWVLGVIQLAFLLGPMCGFFGAKTLKRGLVGIYLGFCIVNAFYKVVFALLTFWLWFLLVAFIQVWITRIVCRFYSVLGLISAERLTQMRGPDYIEKAPVAMVYW